MSPYRAALILELSRVVTAQSPMEKKVDILRCLETTDMFTFVRASSLQYLSYHSLFSLPRCQIQQAVQWPHASKADAVAL